MAKIKEEKQADDGSACLKEIQDSLIKHGYAMYIWPNAITLGSVQQRIEIQKLPELKVSKKEDLG